MNPVVQIFLIVLSALLTFIFGMIAVFLQRINISMKEMNNKINAMTEEFAQSKEKVSGISTGCNARHIDVNERLQDHEFRIRNNEITLAGIKS